jgi:hypothetical protein
MLTVSLAGLRSSPNPYMRLRTEDGYNEHELELDDADTRIQYARSFANNPFMLVFPRGPRPVAGAAGAVETSRVYPPDEGSY